MGDLGRHLAGGPPAPSLLRGVVVVDPVTGALAVNSGGALVRPQWTAGWTPAVGDVVRMIADAGELIVLPALAATPSPGVGALTPAPRVPVAPPGPATTGTATYPATESGRWSTTEGWTAAGYGSRLMQGTSSGTNTGAWFYGLAPAELAGRTIRAARVRVIRSSSWGPDGAAAAHLRAHSSTTRPAGNVVPGVAAAEVVLSRGAAAWTPITVAAAAAVIAGGGLAIVGAPFLALEGIRERSDSGLLQIDWAR